MIALEATAAQLLADIGAPGFDERITDPRAPSLLHDAVASAVLTGTVPDDLYPPLVELVTRRFAHVDAERLRQDLCGPLKKGIGNAYRRGNLEDPTKRVTVRVALTARGAVFLVTDEGAGYDVAGIVERFRRDEQYFQRLGSGFRKFHKTRSLVGFDHGGRTFMLRFLAELEPGRPRRHVADAELGHAADEAHMTAALSASVPFLRSGEQELLGCRVFLPDESKNEQWDVKYELRCRERATGQGRIRILTGQWVEDAQKSLEVATELRRSLRGPVRVPEAVAVLHDPLLVLFDFNPERDLRDLLRECDDPAAAAARIGDVGTCLRQVHGSPLDLEPETQSESLARHEAVARRAVESLAEHDPALARRVEALAGRLEERGAALPRHPPSVPIHGDFGWNRVVEGDNRLYLVGFESFRRGHPGLDLGAAVADLLRFFLLRDNSDPGHLAEVRAALLESYLGADVPLWIEQLPLFVGGALVLRLGRLLARPPKKWSDKAGPLVGLCERVLGGDPDAVALPRRPAR
jgi:hypothetical protein